MSATYVGPQDPRRPGHTNGSATPSESSLEQRVAFRPLAVPLDILTVHKIDYSTNFLLAN